MNFVIVGSGPAGIFAAEAIRRRDEESPVTLITADDQAALSPVMLSYWAEGTRSRETLFFRDRSWPQRMRVDMRTGRKAASLDSVSKKIVLTEGEGIDYDRLLVATGATPISLPVPGMKSKGVTSLRTLPDVEKMLEGCSVGGEVVIIGGGFIGLKLACHLKERGLRVTILEKERKLAFRMFDPKTSGIVKKKLQEKGIIVETGVEVNEVVSDKGWVTGVLTRDGRIHRCQRIVEAVGVRPNVQWLTGSGIDLKGGIPVSDRLETNLPGVYAAGDLAMTIDSITSERVNNATWPAATRQGTIAGTNMAGGAFAYVHNFPMNALNLFGLHVMAAGHSYHDEGSGVQVLLEVRGEIYRKLAIRDDRLIGFILIGDTSSAGHLLKWIKRREEIPREIRNHLLSSNPFHRNLPPNLGFHHGSIFV